MGDLTVEPGKTPGMSLRRLGNEELAERVISGCMKFKTVLPLVVELRDRFDNLSSKETIFDCRTWYEFCKRHLDRTPSAVRKALASTPEKRDTDVFQEVRKKLGTLFSSTSDGNEHAFVVNMESVLGSNFQNIADRQTAELILVALERLIKNFTIYAEKLRNRIRVAGVA